MVMWLNLVIFGSDYVIAKTKAAGLQKDILYRLGGCFENSLCLENSFPGIDQSADTAIDSLFF